MKKKKENIFQIIIRTLYSGKNYLLPSLYGRGMGVGLFLLFPSLSLAQTTWSSSDIADSLKREAYSVVRDYQVTVTANSQKSLTTHYHKVLTILNKKGDNHALWSYPTDDFTQLSSFSGKIYDDQGKVRQKLKRSDVHTSQYSQHLATDNQHNYVEPPVMDYPYTIEYDWEVKSTDGYVDYEFFTPVWRDRQALEKATFKLAVPVGTQIRYMSMPHELNPQKQGVGKNDEYVWTMPSMRCVIDEEYDDDAMYIYPSVLAIPREFRFGETTGILDTWESMGKWYHQLAIGKGNLLPADKQKVKELTANCKTDREKIEALYKYLAEKTRYVSIQLGIGGWQPMKAEEVGKTGFGDCKALTNYMQALLKEAGIESCQTVISTQYSELLKDFPNLLQTNHVILTVPQADGSNLVVECTNPQLPLGFIPGDYAGNQALQVSSPATGEGIARLIRIPAYTPENNYEKLTADVQLQADGKATIKFACDHYGARYGSVRKLLYLDDKERKNRICHWVYLQDPVVQSVKLSEDRGAIPHLNVESEVKATYGKVNGNRMFVMCNAFRAMNVPRFRKDRKRPIVVENAYSLSDEVRITLPEGYTYDGEGDSEEQTSEFGSYSWKARKDGNAVVVTMKVSILKGRYDISKKDDFLAFREKVSKIFNRQFTIEKKLRD